MFENSRFLSGTPRGTRNLIIINIIVFVFTALNRGFMTETFGLFYPASPYFHWWQYVTHLFMHGGFWHIFFNMYSLWLFGSMVERTVGTRKFLTLYFVCGLGAVALHLGVMGLQVSGFQSQMNDPMLDYAQQALAKSRYMDVLRTPTVGASGAIYGLMLAYAMLYPDNRFTLIFPPVTLRAKTMVLIFAAIELFTGVRGITDGVAHFAHLGGMLFALLLVGYWRRRGRLFDDYGMYQ